MFERDLVTLFEGAGGGTFGTDLIAGSAAPVPSGVGPITGIRGTSGLKAERTHNHVQPSSRRPSGQVRVRAGDADDLSGLERAMARAWVLYAACQAVKNIEVNGTYYIEIEPQQEPFDLGAVDSEGRASVVFNILGRTSL